jgi:NCS1 family nucleobase:cation symporter-1
MAAVVIGQCIIAVAVVLTGLVGAKWHVGFPLWNRVGFSQPSSRLG